MQETFNIEKMRKMQQIQLCAKLLARAIICPGNGRWASFEELAQVCDGEFSEELAALKNALLKNGEQGTKEAGEIVRRIQRKAEIKSKTLLNQFIDLIDEYIGVIEEVYDPTGDMENHYEDLAEAYEIFKSRHPELDEDTLNAIAEEAEQDYFCPSETVVI